jgi:Tfp pilus assembly protein PilN
MDLNKEIKLSGLFGRKKEHGAAAAGSAAPPPEKPEGRRAFRRRPKEPRAGLELGAKEAPALPQIPLMRAFNLLPKEDLGGEKQKGPALAQVLVALAAIVALAGLGSFYLFTNASLRDKRDTADDLRIELAGLQESTNPARAAGERGLENEKATRSVAVGSALGDRVAWDRLLRDLSLVLPEDVYVTSLTAQSPTASAPTVSASATGTTTNFAITGSTTEQKSVALLLSRLAILPELTSVQLVSSVRAEGKDVLFTINASVRHEGAAS